MAGGAPAAAKKEKGYWESLNVFEKYAIISAGSGVVLLA